MRDKDNRGKTSHCRHQSLKSRAELIPHRGSFSTHGYYSVRLYHMHQPVFYSAIWKLHFLSVFFNVVENTSESSTGITKKKKKKIHNSIAFKY